MVRKSEAEVGADPRERQMVRARAPSAAGVHATRSDRGGGQPAGGARSHARDARGARPAYGGQQASSDGATAGYRGQIGLRSSWAHAVAHNIEFQPGDVLVTETSAPVWGYNAELERAMIIGAPTDEMRRLFDHTVAAQQVGVRRAAPRRHLRRRRPRGARLLRGQRPAAATGSSTPGHAIGLRNHEAPFLDVGDHTPVEPGMVFTIEPGVYASEVGGFRHSDTVVVTPDGIEHPHLLPERHREPDDPGLGWQRIELVEARCPADRRAERAPDREREREDGEEGDRHAGRRRSQQEARDERPERSARAARSCSWRSRPARAAGRGSSRCDSPPRPSPSPAM